MKKIKKFVNSILIITILIYYLLAIFINNKTYAGMTRQRVTSLDKLTNQNYPGIASMINNLKKSHPNWTFTILYTGLDWNTAIYNETDACHGRSLVQKSSSPWVCAVCGQTPYDNGTWYCASKSAVAYYMDVRNWLNDKYIFAFETLSYDEETQTIEGVKKILSGTFMDKETITYFDTAWRTQTINKSYAQIIMEAAEEEGVSPYHLASRLKQEQGSAENGLVAGNYTYRDKEGNFCKDLVGYYNYFNVLATGSGSETITQNGLRHAKSKGWTTPELAIKGGAEFLAEEYISNYQDCLYLEKYQVDSAGGLYYHQYMQNISAPYSEGYSTYKAYKEMGMLDYSFNFIIPVYENMPTTISPKPGAVTMEAVTENVKVTTSYTDLKIRETPSSGGSILGYVAKGKIILRIEKAKAISEDGRYWDKVVYDNGTKIIIGYAARTDTDGSKYLTVVNDIVTCNEEMQISSDVNLRNGPGTNGTTSKAVLKGGTKVTVIDKMKYKVNSSYWYRVKLKDGTQGYVSSKYLKTIEEETEEPEKPTEPEIIPDNCKIDGNNLIIAPSTKIEDVKGATLEGTATGTGAKIKLNNNNYTLVVLGDVSGDGEADARDSARILKYSIGEYELNGAQKKAADISKDSEIDARDSARILRYSINDYKIVL